MILSVNTNLLLNVANPDSRHHKATQRFFAEDAASEQRFLLCCLVLVGWRERSQSRFVDQVGGSE
jgi:hypothetical protein